MLHPKSMKCISPHLIPSIWKMGRERTRVIREFLVKYSRFQLKTKGDAYCFCQ